MEDDVHSVATPFFDTRSHAIGAIAVAGVATRMDAETISKVATLVLKAGANLTRALGGTTPEFDQVAA